MPFQLSFRPVGSATKLAALHAVGVGRGRRPLLHHEAVADVQPAGRELDVGPGVEDLADVLTRLLADGDLSGRVVLEHHVRSVHRHDRVEVVGVPGVVVAGDRLLESVGRVGLAHSPITLITRRLSRRPSNSA